MAFRTFNEQEESHVLLPDMIETELVYWNSFDKYISFDMGYEFDEMDQSRTFDLDFARKVAVNVIVNWRENKSPLEVRDYLSCVIRDVDFDEETGEHKIHSIIAGVPVEDEDFRVSMSQRYPGVEIEYVSPEQMFIDLPADKSMDFYNEYMDSIELSVAKLISFVLHKPENVVLPFPAVGVKKGDDTFQYDGISRHVGIDGQTYYVLFSKNDNTPGMTEKRLVEFFQRVPAASIVNVSDALCKSVDAVETVFHSEKKKSRKSLGL